MSSWAIAKDLLQIENIRFFDYVLLFWLDSFMAVRAQEELKEALREVRLELYYWFI